jgi:hypothetical protein
VAPSDNGRRQDLGHPPFGGVEDPACTGTQPELERARLLPNRALRVWADTQGHHKHRNHLSLRNTLFTRKRVITASAIALAISAGLIVPAVVQSNALQAKSVAETTALSESNGVHKEQLAIYPRIAKERVDNVAQATLVHAHSVIAQTKSKTDVTPLTNAVAYLSNYNVLSAKVVIHMTETTKDAIATTSAAAAEADRVAAEKAAAAAAAAAQAAAAQAAANTPDGARATARSMAASSYGWGDDQFQCLDSLWSKESGWRVDASNGSSGATGIPQALPGSKMATAGDDWATNAATQIKWGLGYIAGSYGTPCAAWSHSQSVNWY